MPNKTPTRRKRFSPRKNDKIPPNQRSMRPSKVLVGVAVVLVFGVASWLGFLSPIRQNTLEDQETVVVETGEYGLTGARYLGVSPSGRPFEITAEQAQEAQDGSGRVNMMLPIAKITMRDGAKVNVRSNRGVFNKGSNQVDLAGDVVIIQHDRRLRLDTEALHANLKSGEMYSNVPVEAKDTIRQINANSMWVYNNGERIIFRGNAKMIIRNESSNMPANLEVKS